MKPLLMIFLSDLKQFSRDRSALFFTFAFPIFFMLIFGAVFSGEQNISYNIGVVNQDTSPTGAAIVQVLEQIPVFEVSQGEQEAQLQALQEGDLKAVVVIPADLAIIMQSGNTADIQVYYDPSQTTSAPILLSVLRQVVDTINLQLVQQPVLLQIAEEPVNAHNLRDIDYLVPGILGMSILFLGLFGSLTMVERREKKILKRFGATPLPRSIMVFSQVFYRLILALVQAVLIIIIARVAFDVQVVGNWFMLFVLVVLGTLTFISIGYFAVSRVRTTESAMPIIQLIQFPMLFLSGIFFPVEIMPDFMRPIVNAIPLSYLGDAFRQVMVDATPLHSLTTDVAVLAVWLVACMVMAIRLFRWE